MAGGKRDVGVVDGLGTQHIRRRVILASVDQRVGVLIALGSRIYRGLGSDHHHMSLVLGAYWWPLQGRRWGRRPEAILGFCRWAPLVFLAVGSPGFLAFD